MNVEQRAIDREAALDALWRTEAAARQRAAGLSPVTRHHCRQLDVLYAEINAMSGGSLSDSIVGLLPDGRVAVITPTFGLAEVAR